VQETANIQFGHPSLDNAENSNLSYYVGPVVDSNSGHLHDAKFQREHVRYCACREHDSDNSCHALSRKGVTQTTFADKISHIILFALDDLYGSDIPENVNCVRREGRVNSYPRRK
jgi:hypothetical protein